MAMSVWNYVVTAHKPTSVTHSCVGNFTSPHQLNLIVAKCTRIEIHLLTPQGLQPMVDVPIYGRIATLELLWPHNETQDFLFIATERYKFCVLQWDGEKSEFLARTMGDVSDRIGCPTDNGQIGIIDPDCRLIGLHLYDGLFKVIPFDNKGQLKEAFNISFVGRLFHHALEESRPKSVLVHSLSVCISLLDPKRLASASYQASRSNLSHGTLVTASPETIDGMLESLGDLLKLLDISSSENVLPTTYG